jgi:hypothetical protein
MEKLRTLDQKAFEWLQKMPPQTWVRAYFSTFPKCDLLLNNSCEVFNSYILEAREMPVLTMLEQIKGQLMARFYNKHKEVGVEWQGPICPKIRKKVNKNSEWSNTCYAMPSGQGVFQVQDREHSFIVDLSAKTCECRRWDLTGIPCSHAISCLRHERVPAETVLPECYSSKSYLIAYGQTIWPCKDKSTWEKVQGAEILPPVYVKKVGRPPKARKKQPYEIQGKNGPRLSKHGLVITCRYCGHTGHNRAGCSLRKAGLQPNHTAHTDPVAHPVHTSAEHVYDEDYQEVSQVVMHAAPEDMPLLSQLSTMVSQLESEVRQISLQ